MMLLITTLSLIFVQSVQSWHEQQVKNGNKMYTASAEIAKSGSGYVNGKIDCSGGLSAGCVISCDQQAACKNITIYCPKDRCILSCSVDQACQDIKFVAVAVSNVDRLVRVESIADNVTNPSISTSQINNLLLSVYPQSGKNPKIRVEIDLYGINAMTDSVINVKKANEVDINYLECDGCHNNIYHLDQISSQVKINKTAQSNLDYTDSSSESYVIINSPLAVVTCDGDGVCAKLTVSTPDVNPNDSVIATQLNITCDGYESCYKIYIIQSKVDKLSLKCNGQLSCNGFTAFISGQQNANSILCNATNTAQSCYDGSISVHYPYDDQFLSFSTFPDNSESTEPILDGVQMQCIDRFDTPFCTEYTPFPLISDIPITAIQTGNKLLYDMSSMNPDLIKFKQIICEDGQQCDIDCEERDSCTNLGILCMTGSVCNITCSNTGSCTHLAIKSWSPLTMSCEAFQSCIDFSIWLPPNFRVAQQVDVDSCADNEGACVDIIYFCGQSDSFTTSMLETDGKSCDTDLCCVASDGGSDGNNGGSGEDDDGSNNEGGDDIDVMAIVLLCIVLPLVVLFSVIIGVYLYRRNKKMKEQATAEYQKIIN